jgi:hypothetical protein
LFRADLRASTGDESTVSTMTILPNHTSTTDAHATKEDISGVVALLRSGASMSGDLLRSFLECDSSISDHGVNALLRSEGGETLALSLSGDGWWSWSERPGSSFIMQRCAVCWDPVAGELREGNCG